MGRLVAALSEVKRLQALALEGKVQRRRFSMVATAHAADLGVLFLLLALLAFGVAIYLAYVRAFVAAIVAAVIGVLIVVFTL
jgi:hypothetical protein